MASILVLGGAGYVGSAVCAYLLDHGHRVHVLDDLSMGHRSLLLDPDAFTQAQVGDQAALEDLLSQHQFDCAMHFAAKSLVGESVQKPEEYRQVNVEQTKVLLGALQRAGVNKLVFSSSCAVFGDPKGVTIDESMAKAPMSPYGETKLAVEQELSGMQGFHSVSLRYFNAAGAEPKNRVGEWHEPETHLIPRVLQALDSGEPIQVFGDGHATPDGTCVRDYVHVWDLARVHCRAMELMVAGELEGAHAYNLGSEQGFSVQQIIQEAKKVTGKETSVEVLGPRDGDPPFLVANSSKAKKELGFEVHPESLSWILRTAWDWEQKRKTL